MYEILKSDGNRRTVRFTETTEKVDRLFAKIRKQIARDLSLPGFRPGRVPRSIVDRQYGNIIKAEVADTIRQELTSGMLDEQDWILDDSDAEGEPGMPVEGSPYSFEMTLSLFETPAPEGTDGIVIAVPPLDLEDAVEKTLDSFREKMVSFETVKRASREGDLVMLEAAPREEGEDPQEFSVRIGHSHIGEGFDDLVTGVEAGYTFSARMMGEDPEGQDTPVHSFTVTGIREPVLPELDDEFARKAAGVDNLEELREKVTESVRNRYDQEMAYHKERTIIDGLLDSNPFEPPRYMVDNLTRDYLNRLGEENPDESAVRAAGEMARDKVREFLILRAFAEKEGIEVPPEEIKKERSPEESPASVMDRIRNRKALELIISRANITVKEPDAEDSPEEEGSEGTPSWRWTLVKNMNTDETAPGSDGVAGSGEGGS